jgi:hypothetical protein
VSRLRRLLALALVALWLPATLHCALEAAGLDDLFHCVNDLHQPCKHAAPSDTPADACNLIEDASFKPANDTALLPPPALCAGLLRFVAPNPTLVLTPPPSGLSDRIEPPPEVARTWHFTARAALPSRAPSLA